VPPSLFVGFGDVSGSVMEYVTVGTLEPLEIGLGSIQPLRLVRAAIIAIVFVVRMEADSGVVSGRVVELSVVVVGLRLGSP
jgi:hypothetical protein